MTNDPIKHIICAVRGQPESRETAIRAIDLALEHEAHLTFCLVIDFEFLGQAAPTLTSLKAAYRQIEEMGEFSMLILRDRAQRRGVDKVDYLIRRGKIPEQLRKLASEVDADVMVLGRPMGSMGRNIFSLDEFNRFVEDLEKNIGIRIVQVLHQESE